MHLEIMAINRYYLARNIFFRIYAVFSRTQKCSPFHVKCLRLLVVLYLSKFRRVGSIFRPRNTPLQTLRLRPALNATRTLARAKLFERCNQINIFQKTRQISIRSRTFRHHKTNYSQKCQFKVHEFGIWRILSYSGNTVKFKVLSFGHLRRLSNS